MEQVHPDAWFYKVIAVAAIWFFGQIIAELIKNKIRNYNRRAYEQKHGFSLPGLSPEHMERFLNLFAQHVQTQQAILDTLKANGTLISEQKKVIESEREAVESLCSKFEETHKLVWQTHRIVSNT